MSAIDKFLAFLNKGLGGNPGYFHFSTDLEDYVARYYDDMAAENRKFADYVSDVIPDVTEPMEPGMDPTEFYKQLRRIRDTASQYLK
ncbi:nitrogenase subunit molybdenum-iron protein alpha [Schleiferilactobacillus harbinensis]|uniref:Nitrogenase subunit molybdenum-iron protein alpha n=1 Tax=Schleiferilactobacillus harbinensis TaxID=304207 RepID=A0A5P8M6I9_9LACO|nr:nitrogenase subunit molybdenum-iron protein alpha [Schleiferilactobacillus harbinensis]QFR24093.1 nitrogenase subunit molybdenum-iron protein alpha [Schleiferilactobacillus harbinensis]